MKTRADFIDQASMDVERPLKVGLLWHSFRCANLGVGALTISNIEMLTRAARQFNRTLSFHIIGPGGPLWYPPDGIAFEETIIAQASDVLYGTRIWESLSACDIVFDSAGGDSFSDIYGEERLLNMSIVKMMTLALQKPLILSPQTVGPFESRWSHIVGKELSKRCLKIFTRDSESRRLLAEIGVSDYVEETVDIAFRLPFEPARSHSNGIVRVGLNVSGLLYAGGYTGDNQFKLKVDYRSFIEELISTLKKQRNVKVILVPHVLGGVDDDVIVCKDLAQRHGLEVAPLFCSPSDAKSYISGLDLLAGSRMHATIAAISSGVAVVPLAYSRKFSGVFRSVDYPLVGDLTAQDTHELISLTVGALHKISELREAARQSNAIAQEKLDKYKNFLGELLQLS